MIMCFFFCTVIFINSSNRDSAAHMVWIESYTTFLTLPSIKQISLIVLLRTCVPKFLGISKDLKIPLGPTDNSINHSSRRISTGNLINFVSFQLEFIFVSSISMSTYSPFLPSSVSRGITLMSMETCSVKDNAISSSFGFASLNPHRKMIPYNLIFWYASNRFSIKLRAVSRLQSLFVDFRWKKKL